MSSRRRTPKKTPLLVVITDLIPEVVLSKHYDDGRYDSNIASTIVNLSEDGTLQNPSARRSQNNHTPQKQGARKNKRSMIFMSQYKNQCRMYAVMIDIVQNGALPRMTNKPCWWCRSTFSSIPVGCPIKYNKNTPGSTDAKRFEDYLKSINIASDGTNDFFETEGLFCTLSCAKAYALDQLQRSGSSKYKDSLTLLDLIHHKTLQLEGNVDATAHIHAAPSWRMIDEWGGHLTPREFRESFGLVEYRDTINVRRPMLYSTAQYYQEKKIKT